MPADPQTPAATGPIRAMLFDIGNVILKFDFAIALRRIAAHCEMHDPAEVLAAIERIKAGYEDGQIDRAAFLRGAFDVLRYRSNEEEFVAAWADIFEPNPPMLELIEKLHGRLPLFLLSNTSDIHIEHVLAKYEIFTRFSGAVYSFKVKASKPNREIYEITNRQLGLEPAATFFIDDLLPNIETARTMGYRSHHYHYDQHELLLKELDEAGVL